jgi:hypothetical protein
MDGRLIRQSFSFLIRADENYFFGLDGAVWHDDGWGQTMMAIENISSLFWTIYEKTEQLPTKMSIRSQTDGSLANKKQKE